MNELRAALQNRAQKYYDVLQAKDYAAAWSFFEPTMRRDNPQDEYVRKLGTVIGIVEVVSTPKVEWVEFMPPGRSGKPVPIGLTATTLRMSDRAGGSVMTIDRVDWVWTSGSESQSPTWYLISRATILTGGNRQ